MIDYRELDPEQFSFKEGLIVGDECVLITPKALDTKWNNGNKFYRSCIVRKNDGIRVSCGFSKFVNWGEKPDFEPWDPSWSIEARHKLDGSLLIASSYRGKLILRTRGVFDAREHDTGEEMDPLVVKYYKMFTSTILNSERYSILCEHTTPNRIIVLREHNEPTLATAWDVPRPIRYQYNSIAECIEDVEAWEGKEGVVLYSPDGQTLKKIKSNSYRKLHFLKGQLGSIPALIDVYLETSRSTRFEDFFSYIETTLDYECALYCSSRIQLICDSHLDIVEEMQTAEYFVVETIKTYNTRKEQAMVIQKEYQDWKKSYCFALLDGRVMEDKTLVKILNEYVLR